MAGTVGTNKEILNSKLWLRGDRGDISAIPSSTCCSQLSNLEKEFWVLLEGLKKPLSVSEGGRVNTPGISKCSYL